MAALATGTPIQKKLFGSGMTTTIISNEEMNKIMKIIKSFKESCLLTRVVNKRVKNEAKEQRSGFIGTLLSTLFASLLVNPLIGKVVIKGISTITAGESTIRDGECTIRTSRDL